MRGKRGSLLIESIVAINIALIGLLGVLGLLSSSLTLNRDAGQKIIATYLAAEGVEVIKNMIDLNYVDGSVGWNNGIRTGSYEISYLRIETDLGGYERESENVLWFDSLTGIYSYDSGNGEPTGFKRTVRIQENDNDGNVGTEEIVVNSILKWPSKTGLQTINLEDHFFDWRVPAGP